MQSGLKIRNTSLAIAAILSALLQNLLLSFLENKISELPINPAFTSTLIGVLGYAVSFIVTVIIVQKLAKIKWIRVHIFKEKIIEGKWFECVYLDRAGHKLVGYGIVDTFFDDGGEFVYQGKDYSLKEFKETGKFSSTCSSLKYYPGGDAAMLDYAYEFVNYDVKQQGYGNIDFVVGKNGSNRHSGKFFNSDGIVYYFEAILITDKKIIKALGGSKEEFEIAMLKLIEEFNVGEKAQRDKILNVYNLDPAFFADFSKHEDFSQNLKREICSNDFKNKIVLDIGAGTGRFSKYVIDEAQKLICTDISKNMISFLRESEMAQKQKKKMEFYCCNHTSIPAFVKEKVDYIIAGYTIGAYFNNKDLSTQQKKDLFLYIMEILTSLLKEKGKIIIIESLGLKKASCGEEELLDFDKGLNVYFELLEKYGFEKKTVDTSFQFNTEKEAEKFIYGFWGRDGLEKIEKIDNKWVLGETSGIWQKTF